MQQKLWITLSICLVILLFSTQPVLANDAAKIGTIDLQKVLDLSKTGQSVKDSITQKYETYKASLSQQEIQLVALKEEIEKKSTVWDKAVRNNKEREFKRRARELEEDSQYATDDMKEFEQQQIGPIIQELKGIIAEYVKGKGYALILDSSSKGVFYQSESIDISAELAVELDKRHVTKN